MAGDATVAHAATVRASAGKAVEALQLSLWWWKLGGGGGGNSVGGDGRGGSERRQQRDVESKRSGGDDSPVFLVAKAKRW